MANTNLIACFGLDFGDLFIRGSGTQTLGIRDSAGVDIGAGFVAGDAGITTKIIAKDGRDVGRCLGDAAGAVKITTGSWHWTHEAYNHAAMCNKAWAYLDKYESNASKFRTLGIDEAIGSSADRDNDYGHAIYANCSAFLDIPGAKVDIVWVSGSKGTGQGQFMLYTRRHSVVYMDACVVGHGVNRWHPEFSWNCVIKTIIDVPGVMHKEYKTMFGVW